ncbi:TPA: division/outer membrane stress-associated lipid-binding lipoprotein [Escherichia coli]
MQRWFLPFLSTLLLLQGCVAAALVGTAAVGTKVSVDPRSARTQIDDEILEARVSRALSKDSQLRGDARIIVTAYQGTVLLTGQAPDRSAGEKARQIADGVEGTVQVWNEIRTGKPLRADKTATDAWLTTKIRAQLLKSSRVKLSDVKVLTENGEVFLMGRVTEKEGQAAADIASRVAGVKHVITAFSYIR